MPASHPPFQGTRPYSTALETPCSFAYERSENLVVGTPHGCAAPE